MDSNDDLRGAEANPGGAMANQIAALQLQVAELTQMLQSGVKMEAVSGADRQSVKDALESLDGGDLFNEAVAVQYSQAKMQQQQTQREVLQLKRQVQDNAEVWETAQVEYVPFNFGSVPENERKYIRLLAKELGEVDWSTRSVKAWVTQLTRQFNESFMVSRVG